MRTTVALIVFASIIQWTFSCFSGGKYTKDEEAWCRQDLRRCATHLCHTKTTQECNRDQIQMIQDRIECKFTTKCDKLKDDAKHPCMNNLDCPLGRKCRDGSCKLINQGKHCVFDGQCEYYYACQQSQCVLKKIQTCQSQGECPAGTRCSNFLCKETRENRACTRDDQCNPAYRCSQSKCVLIEARNDGRCSLNVDCPVANKCRRGVCKLYKKNQFCSNTASCSDSDYECQKGQCILSDPVRSCYKLSDCFTDERCMSGVCKPVIQGKTCYVNGECNRGYVCSQRQCVLDDSVQNSPEWSGATECQNNFGCAVGKKCREGLCKLYKQGRRCSGDGQCDRLYRCQNNECTLTDLCRQSSDCGQGKSCKGGSCVTEDFVPKMECSWDQQCGTNKKCVRGQCVTMIQSPKPTGKPCRNSLNCSLLEKCFEGFCVKK